MSALPSERTAANCPSREQVIEGMAQRGHELAQGLGDSAYGGVGAERPAEAYRTLWPHASTDQLSELAAPVGLILELEVLLRSAETGIIDPRWFSGEQH